MPGDKRSKKDDGDFELEDDIEVSTEPTIDVEQEMANLAENKPSQDRTTQREIPVTKANMAAPQQSAAKPARTATEAPIIAVEKTPQSRTSPQERKVYKEPPQTSSDEIYKAMKKPDSFGFMRKIVFVALLAAGAFYGQRFLQKTKQLVPFPENSQANKEPPAKSISSQIAELQKKFTEKEQLPEPVEILMDTDLVDIQVLVNGKGVEVSDKRFKLDAGQTYKITVKRNGFFDYQTEVTPTAGSPVKIVPQFNKEFVSGFVTIETTPESKITLLQDGKVLLEGSTPVVGWKAPVGKYKLVIENNFIGYKSEEEFVIYNSLTTNIRRQLTAPAGPLN